MARKLFTIFVLVPLALLFVAFAVANREIVTVSFDPFDSAQPAFSLAMPLFVLILVLLMVGVVIGGAASWLGQGRWRRTARHLDADVPRFCAPRSMACDAAGHRNHAGSRAPTPRTAQACGRR